MAETRAAASFEQAMESTAAWLTLWESGELSDEVLAERVGEMVRSRDGARGFFVVALAGDSPLMDRLPEPLLRSLRDAGAAVVDLTARNLAMSTAMALHHERVNSRAQMEGSLRVRERCRDLLRQLETGEVTSRLQTLLAAARDGEGEDTTFLDRWGYDRDQKAAIAAAVQSVAD
jgi:hypothetical protein